MKSTTDTVLELVKAERVLQEEKWGKQNHPASWWMVILMEEIGEVAKAYFEFVHTGDVALLDVFQAELTQSAAVLVAWIENNLRNGP